VAAIEGCNLADATTATNCDSANCKTGYIHDTGVCHKCSSVSIENFASCTYSGGAVATPTCATGYVLSGASVTAGVCYEKDP